MSNKSKGTALERKAKELLESQSFLTHRTVSTPIFAGGRVIGSHNNDVFGIFDLIAVHPDGGCRFIQVTVSDCVGERQAKVEQYARCFPATVSVEVWGWVGGRKAFDQRTTERRPLRRQYFRVLRWWTALGRWSDVTPGLAGWVDGWYPPDVVHYDALSQLPLDIRLRSAKPPKPKKPQAAEPKPDSRWDDGGEDYAD